VLFWDWRGEYDGPSIDSYRGVAEILRRRSFSARYVPARRPPGDGRLADEAAGLAYVLAELGRDLTIVWDEIALVCRSSDEEGGPGWLLRYARPQAIGVWWATQFPSRIPTVLLGETRRLFCFHLDHPAHLAPLRTYLDEPQLRELASLPPYDYLEVNK